MKMSFCMFECNEREQKVTLGGRVDNEGSLITPLAWSVYEPVANHLALYCKAEITVRDRVATAGNAVHVQRCHRNRAVDKSDQ